MATFSYVAKTSTGQTVTGILTAENQTVASRMLDDRSLFPLEVREGGKAARTTLAGQRKKIGLKALTNFYSQLADLLRAGVPALRALDVLSRQSTNPLLGEIVREIHADVSAGETLADSMVKHPNAFNELSIAMVRAGEEGGFLEDVLGRIAIFTERQDELRNKLIGSLIYPAILLFAGVGVVTALMLFVVPKLRQFIMKIERPWITDVLFAVSDFIAGPGIYVIAAMVVAMLMTVPWLKSEQGRYFVDKWKLQLPVAGRIFTMVSICRFCRILGTMLHNGVPILHALTIAKDSAGNLILAEEIGNASESVQKGESLATPLSSSGLFPPDILDMIAVAEESNNLEAVLVQIADSNEARTGREIDLGVRLLEPVMLVVMAVMVGTIGVALLVPVLRMSSAQL